MKKILVLLTLVMFNITLLQAEITIIKEWSPTITGTWNYDPELTYTNTVYGNTYYNSNWQDMKKTSNIISKSVWRYFYLKPHYPKTWGLSIPITNLNAEAGKTYFAKNNPKQKQASNQIYWSIIVGYKANGVSRIFTVWIKREYVSYNPSGYIAYNIDHIGWKQSPCQYPSCSRENPPKFQLETNKKGSTSIRWGGCTLTILPVYIEELSYIKIQVGTQANIQIGEPCILGEFQVNAYKRYMKQGDFLKAKEDLFRTDQTYLENQAYNLAFCYAKLGEYYNALDMCNALINHSGERLSESYALRGMIKESMGQKQSALEDYKLAGDVENYNRLRNEL